MFAWWYGLSIACTLPSVGEDSGLEPAPCDSSDRKSSVELRVVDRVGLPVVPDVVSFEHDGIIEEVVLDGSSYVRLGDGDAGLYDIHVHAVLPDPDPHCVMEAEGGLSLTVPSCAAHARQETLVVSDTTTRCN